jgi:Golgi apyrase
MGNVVNFCQRRIIVILLGIFAVFLIFIFIAIPNGHIFANKTSSLSPASQELSTPNRFDVTNWDVGRNYAIVIDAGSSGSRVMIYSWNLDKGKKDELVKIETGTQDGKDWNRKIKPGLSSFGKDEKKGKKDELNEYLKNLVDFAEIKVPKSKWDNTPLYLYGTAGLRLLPDEDSKQLLEDVCVYFKHNTSFIVEDCDNQVTIIDGESEGAYGWLSLNYLEKKLTKKGDETIGFLDMGGASTQIAFLPHNHLQGGIEDVDESDLYAIQLKTAGGEAWDYNISSYSFLDFGINRAQERYLEYLEKEAEKNEDKNIKDACFLPGYEKAHANFTHVGEGDFDKCQKAVLPILKKNAACKKEPCVFDGVHLPKFDMNKDRFMGVSEYYYTTKDLLKKDGGEFDPKLFDSSATDFCKTSLGDHLKKNPDLSEFDKDNLPSTCFKATWLKTVLHEGFGLEKSGIFESINDVGIWEVSWTLGALITSISSRIPVQSVKAEAEEAHPVSLYRVFILIIVLVALYILYILFNRKKPQYTNPIEIPRRLDDLEFQDEESTIELLAQNDPYKDSAGPSSPTRSPSFENIKRRPLSSNNSETNLSAMSSSTRVNNRSEASSGVNSPRNGFRRN